jgi:hypothetical protein
MKVVIDTVNGILWERQDAVDQLHSLIESTMSSIGRKEHIYIVVQTSICALAPLKPSSGMTKRFRWFEDFEAQSRCNEHERNKMTVLIYPLRESCLMDEVVGRNEGPVA